MKFETKDIATQGIIAAIYVVLCLAVAPLSFGLIQFRLGEALMILPFYNKKSAYSLTIGCFLVNLFSSMGPDIIFGTLATGIGVYLATKASKDWQVPIIMSVVNGLIIGMMLKFVLGLPLIASILSVAASELFIVVIGMFVFRKLMSMRWFQEHVQDHPENGSNYR